MLSEFLEAMRSKRLLHLGHKDADCDALGSAYAMNCLLPGDVGFAQGIKGSAHDLAAYIGLSPVIDPDPAAYDYTIIYDSYSASMLGMPVPARYALFDHHEPGGHRFATFHSELKDGAEWAFVKSIESTCSLLIDLFQASPIEIDQTMGIALAAGIVTDTSMLRHANAAALQRLAIALEAADIHLETVLNAVDSPASRASRRSAVLDAVQNIREFVRDDWCVLATVTDSPDYGFILMDILTQLGADIGVVSFPRGNNAMLMADCGTTLADINLGELVKSMNALETWGSPIMGRVIASASPHDLLETFLSLIIN